MYQHQRKAPVRVLRHRETEAVVQRALLSALEDVELVVAAVLHAHVGQAGRRGAVALHDPACFCRVQRNKKKALQKYLSPVFRGKKKTFPAPM